MDRLNTLKTPCYILDKNKLESNFTKFENAFQNKFGNNFILSYSFKTNSLPWLVKWVAERGNYAEVVSSDEYLLAEKVGFSRQKIILNGPLKGNDTIIKALESGSIVNLDNFEEINLLVNSRPNKKD